MSNKTKKKKDSMNKNIEQTLNILGNKDVPLVQRSIQLIDILAGAEKGDPKYTEIVNEVFNRLQTKEVISDEIRKKAEYLDNLMKNVMTAPLRPATFLHLAEGHALVSMENGEWAFVVIADRSAAENLRTGDNVMVDSGMKLLAKKALNGLYCGLEATFVRSIDDRHLEISNQHDEKAVVIAGDELQKQIDSKQVSPGDLIVLSAGGKVAPRAVPKPDKDQVYYRFLDKGTVPDVQVNRDIGNPPRIINEVALHIREEMTRPELRRKFRLRPCITRLLCGVSGTGKSLAIAALHRLMYEIMAEVTDTPIEELPPRVFRINSGKLLSMWFGQSDKNMEQIFDEVEMKSEEKYTNRKGKQFHLPVMVVLEEAEGLGRARGEDSVYDRVMTVMLQRLDPNREGLSRKLVIFLSTTNAPHIVDPAFLRRIGGSVETFGRLDKDGFQQILHCHIDGLPIKSDKDQSPCKALREMVNLASANLFNDPSDRGVVELTYQGQQNPVVKYRRDFLTGALIDRAVQLASTFAWQKSIADDPESVVTPDMLWNALDRQVFSVVHQLDVNNIHQYTDLPDGVRVTRVRRLTPDKEAIYA